MSRPAEIRKNSARKSLAEEDEQDRVDLLDGVRERHLLEVLVGPAAERRVPHHGVRRDDAGDQQRLQVVQVRETLTDERLPGREISAGTRGRGSNTPLRRRSPHGTLLPATAHNLSV